MEGSNFILIGVMMGIFFFSVMVYIALMIFYPEWVGITGKETKEAEQKRMMGVEVKEDDDLITKWSSTSGPKDSSNTKSE